MSEISMTLSLPSIAELNDPELAAALRHKIERKTVPHGALGRLATLAERLGLILGTTEPRLLAPQLVVCAADHGIAARGVSAYPSDVTWQMVGNFLAGGAAVSVLARQHGIVQTVVDCGVRHDFAPAPGLLIRKVAAGTQDASAGQAMTAAQCDQALANLNRNEVFAGLGHRIHKDFPTITWTADQLGKGIFYHDRELNEAFTTVFT